MAWDPELYDREQSFVPVFGQHLLDLVDTAPGQRIWDLGCGTGSLTAELAKNGAEVIGTDSSPEMIAQAKKNYPQLTFLVENALEAKFDAPFDTVFSNAVFHWIPQQVSLLKRIYESLKPGGNLVCEMGAQGNIQAIETAFTKALEKRGATHKNFFYFPDLNHYGALLDACGFQITYIREYDRPTPFPPGEEGLAHWIHQFYSQPLSSFSPEEQKEIISEMEQELKPALWQKDRWVGDYRRLQFRASKKHS